MRSTLVHAAFASSKQSIRRIGVAVDVQTAVLTYFMQSAGPTASISSVQAPQACYNCFKALKFQQQLSHPR